MKKREIPLIGVLVVCAVAIAARQLFKLHQDKDVEQKAIDAYKRNVPGL